MRLFLASLFVALSLSGAAAQPGQSPEDWDRVVDEARGQTVYWNAWGGDQRINDYIAWVGTTVEERYGVAVRHVPVADISESVARILAERTAGRDTGGSVDLLWINGENFAAMRAAGLLYGPFTEALPNFSLVDTEGKPTTLVDFTVPTDGLESPWGMAQFVFMIDAAVAPDPPTTLDGLLAWAEANPGRFTYPTPPDFIGSTFLKQVMVSLAEDPDALSRPVAEADFDAVTRPLWDYLDALHPHLWRRGMTFPSSGPELKRLLADGEVDIALSFNPGEASRDIASGFLPDTVRTFVLDGGTIGNSHFVAIPYNSAAAEGAMVVANFLLSPEAQLRKQDPTYWGDGTVLDLDALDPQDRAAFDALDLGIATLSPEELGQPLPEPHPSWMTRLEAEWLIRYGAGQ